MPASDRRGELPLILTSVPAADRARPLLTYYDDATGERVDLSAITLENWANKTANLLVDDCGLGVGDRAAVLLPPHWQTAAVLFGIWSAGLSAEIRSAASDGVPSAPGDGAGGSDAPGDQDAADQNADAGEIDVVFAALNRVSCAPPAVDRFVLGLAPMGTPLDESAVPAGFRDYVAEVRGQADEFGWYPQQPDPDARNQDTSNDQDLVTVAHDLAISCDLHPGDRVLVDTRQVEHPVRWLLAPLTAGASVVLCANLDPGSIDYRARAERVTRIL
jgi:hypothetical protein